ncbi:LysR family transcriptional regulator [Kitasatospora aureofaciens]|uniref:LysR substrate-binding domain-containing protein n=1 Tax=Kitasatospora aureofaciens TaxID=1894 RepID=UPI001C440E92|nr:LysR substrate-binding domain-containing protein [Kitasatospora aureofaciens]MBV6696730.1 LysR family transcriptional regulator [Kitasatospora aureofaciens]
MELRQIRYFLAVAEELHFGRAAERMHIVQSTVSQQIRRLERELGLELFDRNTRSVVLTPAGSVFVDRARAVLAAERAALEAMAAVRAERTALLRIGTNVGLGARLERLLAAVARRAPDLTVELVSAAPADRLQRVRDGELDAAFVRGVTRSPGLDLVPVWRERFVVALPAGHALAAHERVDLADLAGMPLRIAPRETNPHLVDLIADACRSAGFEPVLGPAFTTDQDTLAAIGAGGSHWTVFYAGQAEVLPATRTVFRPLADPAPTMPTFLAVREGATARGLAVLLDSCRDVAGDG